MWGGLECTLNRVGDSYHNQCEKNGHTKRLSDLALFKNLGIQKLRYPCLWELVAPKNLDHCNWSYLDERLGELRRLEQNFIAGFLHHGSGPMYTSLVDPDFPVKLATYARLFARRYPWVNDYTPINEINTTARFSVLYGHWYPHLKCEISYLKSLLLQCKGTVMAMKEIRAINPCARLIQTDDLGKCQSTDEIKNQCEFENERRWLSWDLISGMVTKDHPLYLWFIKCQIHPKELEWFERNATPPDVIGINHYHLSNRYLDHRVELFPEWSHGGNGFQTYADIGSIDTGLVDPIEPEEIFREAWIRYKRTIAITECHTMGFREAQMRWLAQIWTTCKMLRSEGVDIEAVTAWSLIGTYDWHTLCTKSENFYEAGVFDLRNPEKIPKPTTLSRMVNTLARSENFESPLLGSEGRWRTGRRIIYNAKPGQFTSLVHDEKIPPILITGGRGTLGQAFARMCGERNIKYQLLKREDLELTNRDSIEAALEKYRPWAIINAAGYVRVDEAETDYQNCFRANVEGAVKLARVCKDQGIRLVNFSSDLVFDGRTIGTYSESHLVNPLNVYGKSKADCEEQVLSLYPDSLIIRTSAFFGPWDEYNFVTQTLQSLAQDHEVFALKDTFVSPTYVPDLVNETLSLLIDQEKGIIHIANAGEVSWEQFAIKAALTSRMNLRTDLIKGVSEDQIRLKAKRPKRSVLVSERQQRLSSLDNAIERYFHELQISIGNKQENRP
jgi:dTDP-4-dehydrorhamnose reductase